MDIESRIKGALYGFAIGDAMGATTEFLYAHNRKGKLRIRPFVLHPNILGCCVKKPVALLQRVSACRQKDTKHL